MQGLSIGRLAKLANVSIDTIRFYEKAGLLPPHARRPSGFREYSPLDLKQLRFIRRGRLLGLSLEEIGELLALDGGQEPASLIERQLQLIDRRIGGLERWRECLRDFSSRRTPNGLLPRSILDCYTDEADDSGGETLTERSSRTPLRDRNDET